MSSNFNITIAIDDIHPEKGWGLPGDDCMEYLEDLNINFDAKFTLFIPSNYHKQYPLSEHKDWIDWLKSKEYFELAAHGHYHMCERADIGECEFFELDTYDKVKSRIDLMMKEWKAVDHQPIGWRNPGWLAHPEAVKQLGSEFKYAAIHYEHNHNLRWDCKMIYGYDGIHETNISTHNENVMFSSHIAGDWNDNVWNQTNYEQLKTSLLYLHQQGGRCKTISEIL
tara:strand:+ start:87 stop:761 length:675 start_codon:yes stop_codon:yes gene_type:complete